MTIKEVAELAGVSSAAVSRYLNGGSLSEEKRERIRKTIEETGYHPNLVAQTMRTGHIRQIGVIVPKIHSDSVSQVTAGIARQLRQRGYVTLLGSTDHEEGGELGYLDIMQNNQVAGVILMGTCLTPILSDAMRECRVPLVVTGQNYPGFACVYHDDYNAVRELTRLLLERGHDRIAFLGVTEKDVAAGQQRRLGALDAVRGAGLDPNAVPVTVCEFTAESGYLRMKEILKRHPEINGAVCATDTIALGAMKALREQGRKIPEEFGIAGVGDSWACSTAVPELTSAHLYYRECGEDAAAMLLSLIEQQETEAPTEMPVRQMMLGYKIIERGSV
ncbi:MAG: LacI family DNA-binding transcriptional regulator [Lachnospiraceae bacterium]|nr:LacI family DNA-binding transcriptional regulator [Lachnospiraceae bacterium]